MEGKYDLIYNNPTRLFLRVTVKVMTNKQL